MVNIYFTNNKLIVINLFDNESLELPMAVVYDLKLIYSHSIINIFNLPLERDHEPDYSNLNRAFFKLLSIDLF